MLIKEQVWQVLLQPEPRVLVVRQKLIAVFLLSGLGGVQAEQVENPQSHGTLHHHAEVTAGMTQGTLPSEPGQSAFAAIQEIVMILDADPNTDWSLVDIAALRRHLIDMSNVTLYADVRATRTDDGWKYVVTGSGPVRGSIRRMVTSHALTMNGRDGWVFQAEDHPEGAVLKVSVSNPVDVVKLGGLGFIGVMTYGMHHQEHHLMIATGVAPRH